MFTDWHPTCGDEYGDVVSVVFSSDSKMLISGYWDNTIWVWGVATGAPIGQPLQGNRGGVHCIFPSARSSYRARLTEQFNYGIHGRLWHLANHFKDILALLQVSHISQTAPLVASGSKDQTIRLWDHWDAITAGAIGEPLRRHAGNVISLVFLPDGLQLVSGSGDHTIKLWDTGAASGEQSQHTDFVSCIAISGDDKYIASCSK